MGKFYLLIVDAMHPEGEDMKNTAMRIMILVLVLFLCAGLFACNKDETPDNGGNTDGGTTDGGDTNGGTTDDDGGNTGNEGGIDWDKLPLEGLALIYDGKARFQVVYATASGATAVREANNFVAELRELGVEISDAVSDKDAENVRECEIIIGTDVRNREDASVSEKYLGKDGYCIKVVGKRIVIAATDSTRLQRALKSYKEEQMGITKKTKELRELAVAPDYFSQTLTTYDITSITVGGVDLREYTIFEDYTQIPASAGFSVSEIKGFRDDLYDESGYWLEYGKLENIDSCEKRIILRYVADKSAVDEAGFAAYVTENGDFIVECSYANAFNDTFAPFMASLIYNKTGAVKIPANYKDTVRVCEVTYEQFGANGSDNINDFEYILATHTYANQCGQTVVGKEGATYYVGPSITQTIPIKTNVDFNGCTIIINDLGSEAYKTRGLSLFSLVRDHANVTLTEATVDEVAGKDVKIKFGDTSIPWLAEYIETKSLVMISNSYHKDFVRFGANQSSGETRKDIFIMYPDGSIDPETEVCFEFDEITLVEISRVDDVPVTVKNGNFINICCRVVAETEFKNKYNAYNRGFRFERSNVTFENITHRMQDEPNIDTSFGPWGELKESYPYYAFIYTAQTYNLLIKNCDLTGHTTYYEDKDATASTGGVKPNPVAQGTYDIAVERSIGVHFLDTEQYAPTGLGDSRYWGIMTSNWSKNMIFENCDINRFDAHRSFWGAKMINCNIGHSINLVGGGELYMENVTKMVSGTFISIRGDYGGTFSGNIHMVDCTLAGVSDYNTVRGTYYNASSKVGTGIVFNVGYMNNNETGYWDWDFGYPSYMPQNIIIDNFKSGTAKTYLFPQLHNEVFTEAKYPLHITQSVTFRNMAPIPMCVEGEMFSKLNSIPYTVERDEE